MQTLLQTEVRPAIECEKRAVREELLRHTEGLDDLIDYIDVYTMNYRMGVYYVVKTIADCLLFIEADGEIIVPTDDMVNEFRSYLLSK